MCRKRTHGRSICRTSSEEKKANGHNFDMSAQKRRNWQRASGICRRELEESKETVVTEETYIPYQSDGM